MTIYKRVLSRGRGAHAASWDFYAACTPDRLAALDSLLTHVSGPAHPMTLLSVELLAGLRAAMERVEGEGVTP